MDYLLIHPVFRSILFPQTMMGLPVNFATAVLILTAAFVLALAQWWFLIVTVALFVVGKRISKGDPFFFDVAISVLKHATETD